MTAAIRPNSRTVLVTGAAGTLGRAVASLLDRNGANLVLLDQDARGLSEIFDAKQVGAQQLQIAVDLLDFQAVEAAVACGAERFGQIDSWCHTVGAFRMGELVHETSDEQWQFLFDVNVGTLRKTARAVVPRLVAAGGGSIVTVGALSSRQGIAGMSAYVAAKDAVLRLSESMAAELGAHGIRVNCVLPSTIDTAANRASMPNADVSRWVPPAAIAHTIAWLCSPSAVAVHGVGLPVTGPI